MKDKRKSATYRLPAYILAWLRRHPKGATYLIERALIETYGIKKPE